MPWTDIYRSGGIAPPILTSALDAGEYSALRSCRFISRGNSPQYPSDRRLGGSQIQSALCGARKIFFPCQESNPRLPFRTLAVDGSKWSINKKILTTPLNATFYKYEKNIKFISAIRIPRPQWCSFRKHISERYFPDKFLSDVYVTIIMLQFTKSNTYMNNVTFYCYHSSYKNGLKLSLLSATSKIKYTLRVKRFVKWASGKEMCVCVCVRVCVYTQI
jgi:hypothetical protein